MNFIIRNEIEKDYHAVENLTREAFWNLFVPGCSEHFLAHTMRSHPDFLPDLDLVAVINNEIVGNIMYTRSSIATHENDEKIDALTFGPISVLPEYQRTGIGSALIEHSINLAKDLSESIVIIHGHPRDYCKFGFRSARDFEISDPTGRFPYSMLALVLNPEVIANKKWKFSLSPVFNVNQSDVEEFDRAFPPKKKEFQPSQVEFSIATRASLS